MNIVCVTYIIFFRSQSETKHQRCPCFSVANFKTFQSALNRAL